jgi:hypothetical protein
MGRGELKLTEDVEYPAGDERCVSVKLIEEYDGTYLICSSQLTDSPESSWMKLPLQHWMVAALAPGMSRGLRRDVCTIWIITVFVVVSTGRLVHHIWTH